MTSRTAVAMLGLLAGCAHQELAGADLARISRPAFVSRIEEGAGPRSTAFSDDSTYQPKLGPLGIDAKEADRRLREKLGRAMTRFEISDRLRATTLALLPHDKPWTDAVNPAEVAHALESFLVEEVPANPPNLDTLRSLGSDAVVEIVVESYGIRSEQGHAGLFLEGFGRLVLMESKREVWRRAFRVDQLDSGEAPLDPFAVAREISAESKGIVYRSAMETLLDGVAALFAKELTPGKGP